MAINIGAIALSAGHHPKARGAMSNNFTEYGIASSWLPSIKERLRLLHVDAYLVPTGQLQHKVAYINKFNNALAIELHFNAGGRKTTSGCETLHYPKSNAGVIAARCLNDAIVTATGVKDRGIKEGWYKMDRPKIKDFEGDIDGDETLDYFLKATNCPALILEPNFIQQSNDLRDRRDQYITGIVNGILAYISV